MRRVGPTVVLRASTACSPSRSGIAPRAATTPRARSLRHQAALLRTPRRPLLFGSEIKAILAAGRSASPRSRRSVRVLHLPELSSRSAPSSPTSNASCRPLAHHRVATEGEPRSSATGTSTSARPRAALRARVPPRNSTGSSARRCSRQLVSDVPVGCLPERRHRLRRDHGHRRALSCRTCTTFTGRLRSDLRFGPRTRLRRARKAEHMSYLFETEHYEMVLKAGDMERVMPALVVASRGAARRPELPELLRRRARQQVRARSCSPAPAATSSSAAIRGATTARSSTTTSSTTSTSTTPSGSAWLPNRIDRDALQPIWHDVERRVDRATSSASVSADHADHSTRPRTT